MARQVNRTKGSTLRALTRFIGSNKAELEGKSISEIKAIIAKGGIKDSYSRDVLEETLREEAITWRVVKKSRGPAAVNAKYRSALAGVVDVLMRMDSALRESGVPGPFVTEESHAAFREALGIGFANSQPKLPTADDHAAASPPAELFPDLDESLADEVKQLVDSGYDKAHTRLAENSRG